MDLIYRNRPVSQGTLKSYDKMYNSLKKLFPNSTETEQDGITIASEPNILNTLHEHFPNPNTMKTYLYLIIVIKKMNGRSPMLLMAETERLKKRVEVEKEERKEEKKAELPSIETVAKYIDGLKNPLSYVLNYLCFYNALRNQDLQMKVVAPGFEESPEENYLVIMKTRCKIIINKYKTFPTYGRKEWVQTEKKFFKMAKQLPLDVFTLTRDENEKVPDELTSYYLRKHFMDDLTEADYCKIMVTGIVQSGLDINKRLSAISTTRGTSVEMLMSDYLM